MAEQCIGLGRGFRPLILAFAGGLAFAAAQPAQGQALDDKYWIAIAGYWPSADSSGTLSRPNAPGTDIDFESDLGIDKSKVLPSVTGGAKFGRFVVQAEYYALDRNGSRTLTRDLMFDGVTYPANVSVGSKFDSNIYRGSIGYIFLRSDQAELGASIGLHVTDFKLTLNGQGQVGNSPVRTSQRSGHDFLAPLPTVGLFGTYEVAPKVILNGRVDYLSLNVGDYDGGVLNLEATAAYRFNQTFQVGAGWRYVDYNLDVNKDNYTAKVDYKFSGPLVFLRLGFR